MASELLQAYQELSSAYFGYCYNVSNRELPISYNRTTEFDIKATA
jgi:hypothetical protein